MYATFFGLERLPFNLTPDPAFLFLTSKHREALAGLTYAVLERKGFVVLTGDAGTGKTTLLSRVLNRLPGNMIESSIILNPTLTPAEFLEMVMLDFEIPEVPVSKAQRLWKLQKFLSQTHQRGKIAILVIDEAHKLSVELLEEIRLLGNFEYASDKFLQIVLLGQCELDDILNRQDLRQFKQRIALHLYIDPLEPEEIEEYIRFRWKQAGGKEAPPFTPEALKGIAQWSRGIPRLINSLCDTAILLAYVEECRSVGLNYVKEAAGNLGLLESPTPAAALPSLVPVAAAPENHSGPKLVPVQEPALHNGPSHPRQGDYRAPDFAGYGSQRTNSSVFRWLAGKLGATH
jgi:general secretion pathway protein A